MDSVRVAADHYAAAITLLGVGDEVGARRAVEMGLARTRGPRSQVIEACLDDLAAQLDGEAALRRLAEHTPGPQGWLADPSCLAEAIMRLGRAHLVESVIEELAHLMPEDRLIGFVHVLAAAGTPACDDLVAIIAGVVEGAVGAAAGWVHPGVRTSPIAHALTHSVITAAWSTAPAGAPDQQQVIVAVARDAGRVAPLVALLDHDDLGATLRDAFFLPDMVPARLDHEVLRPMAAAGLPAAPIAVGEARALTVHALTASLAIGRHLPSEAHQAVVARIRRLAGCAGGSSTPVYTGA